MLFGLGTPLTKALVAEVPPLPMAVLLYGGAALALLTALGLRCVVTRHDVPRDSPLQRRDWPWLVGMLLCGAVVGPLCMLIGLRQVSGVHGALLLNLEAPLTILLAVCVFREHVTKTESLAVGAILVGAMWL